MVAPSRELRPGVGSVLTEGAPPAHGGQLQPERVGQGARATDPSDLHAVVQFLDPVLERGRLILSMSGRVLWFTDPVNRANNAVRENRVGDPKEVSSIAPVL